MVSYGDLQSLGAMLRQTRETHALTLEEVEAQTRIRVKFIEALENGDLSVLPSPAHAKGFLRNYAQFLRLDANAVAADFGVLTGSSPAQAPAPTLPPSDAQGPVAPAFDQDVAPPSGPPHIPTPYSPPTGPLRTRSTYVPPAQRVGPAVPSGVPAQSPQRSFPTQSFGMTVPAMQPQVIQPDRPASPVGRVLQSNLIVGGVLLAAMIGIAWWAVVQLGSISSDTLVTTPEATGLVVASGGATTPPDLTTSTPTPESGGGAAVPLDRVLLSITVSQRSWARIVVDGAVSFEGQLVPGSVVQYQGTTSILLRAGNAAGLSVNYNGQDLGTLGGPGEVVERIFTTTGQITPTVTPTLTPTNTLVPTSTPHGTLTATPRP